MPTKTKRVNEVPVNLGPRPRRAKFQGLWINSRRQATVGTENFSTLDLKSLKPNRPMPAYGRAVKTPNRSKVEQVRQVKDELAWMKQDAIDVQVKETKAKDPGPFHESEATPKEE